jgi:hypothetical protein
VCSMLSGVVFCLDFDPFFFFFPVSLLGVFCLLIYLNTWIIVDDGHLLDKSHTYLLFYTFVKVKMRYILITLPLGQFRH